MTPDQFLKLKRNIQKTGNYPSLIVLATGENYLLLDGHNRAAVLEELGHEEAWCEIWDVTQEQADLILATMNRIRGTDDNHKRAKLVKKLHDDIGQEILAFLPESQKSMKALLRLAEEDFDNLEDELEIERGLAEEQMAQVIDRDEAKRLAKSYKILNDDKLVLSFVFEDELEYFQAQNYFGRKKASVTKLMELLHVAENIQDAS